MPQQFTNPGAAFSDAFSDALMQQAAQRRQAILDSLAMQREQRLLRGQDQQLELQKAELEDRKAQREFTKQDREAARGERSLASGEKLLDQGMPGDQIPPEIAQSLLKASPQLGLRMKMTPPPEPQPSMEPPNALVAQLPPSTYENVGTPQQRQTIANKKAIDTFIGGLEGDDSKDTNRLRTGLQYEQLTGKNMPAGYFGKDPNAANAGVVRDSAGGLIRIAPDNTVLPIMSGDKQVQGFHPPPQPVVIQTPSGPMLATKGAGTATPITGPDGKPIQAQPTGTTRTMMEGAKMLQPHISSLGQLATQLDQRGLFGPIMSRVRTQLTKAGTIDELVALFSSDPDLQKLGATDPLVGRFATELSLLASGAGRVHGGARGGGSPAMYGIFKEALGDASSLPMFLGRLEGLNNYIGGYAAGPGGEAPPSTATQPTSGGTRRLRYNPATGKGE